MKRFKPSYFVKIRVPMEPIIYDIYRKHLKQHLDGEALQELGVYPADYSTHSFRKGSLSMLADGKMHPAFIQKSACHKRWESSVTYIEASLPKALKATIFCRVTICQRVGALNIQEILSRFLVFYQKSSLKITI